MYFVLPPATGIGKNVPVVIDACGYSAQVYLSYERIRLKSGTLVLMGGSNNQVYRDGPFVCVYVCVVVIIRYIGTVHLFVCLLWGGQCVCVCVCVCMCV